MRWLVSAAVVLGVGCGDPTITDPCPGMLTCPDENCCPSGFPYHCGTQCFPQPCTGTQLTCVSPSRTDGCYGGTWNGSYSGTFMPAGGGMMAISGSIVFDITSHAISASQPASGTGTIDCETGIGTWTLSTGLSPQLVFHGVWMHTSDMGDKIGSPTITAATGGTASGTWSAVRIY
jgi:hypothetical protein